MKNKIFLPAVVFVCAISSSALAISKTQAYDPYYPGSIVNPLQVQIISNPG